MKRILILGTIFLLCGIASAQQQPTIINADNPKGIGLVKAPSETTAIKMPAEYSAQLASLQEQSKKLDKDYEQVITLFKEYAAKRDAIQAQAAVLITRAALVAKLTIEQLDNSTLAADDKGNYSWTPRPKPSETAKGTPSPAETAKGTPSPASAAAKP